MRLLGVCVAVIAVVLGSACGGGSKSVKEPAPVPDPIAKTTGPACKVVADHMAQVALAGRDPAQPDDTGKVASALRTRCETDGWSDEARSCFATMQNDQEAEGCHGMLTPEQRKALDKDVKPATPAEPPKAEAAAAPPPPAPTPTPSRSRGAVKKKPAPSKSTGSGTSADPCQGGE
ncbi:MAG TPA: hypothetical protein VFQ53_14290 [Kofleriaceae bacterium]|nr:hypothetical protein [Kofleriaceae bacterium]